MMSRTPHPHLMIALVAASLVGCTSAPAGLLKLGKAAPGVQAPIVPAGQVIGNNGSTLIGVARVPSAQLVSNHGAGLIGNNSSGLIGNNGSALIGNNAGAFRVAALDDKLVPLEGAVITVTDAQGRPLTDRRVTTDAQGRYTLPGLQVDGSAVFVRASRTQGAFTLTLLSIAAAPTGARELTVDLDPVTTLVAKKTARLVASGKVSPKALNPEALAAIAASIAPAVTDRDLVAGVVQSETAAEKTFDALLDQNPTIKKEVGDVATAAQTPDTAVPAPTPTPRRSGGGGSSGGGSSTPAAPTASADTTVSTVGLHSLVRVAGDDVGTLALGTTPLTAGLGRVNGLALGPDGTLYVADGRYHHIRALPPGAPSTVVAGAADGGDGLPQSNVPATSARFRTPVGLLFDATRQALVVCDSGNNRLRAFAPGGRMITIAGGGNNTDPEAPATSARLDEPWGLAADANGNLYFAEKGSGKIRKLSSSGTLTTLATLAPDQVGAVAVDPVRNCLFVAVGDKVHAFSDLNGTTIMLLDPTFTATGESAGRRIVGLAADGAGVLYVQQTGTTLDGRVDTRLWRVAVEATGAARAGRVPEAIAGTGEQGATAGDYVGPTAPLADARTHPLAAAGECGLALDLALGADTATRAGQIYLGHSFDDGATRWGQVLKLEAVE